MLARIHRKNYTKNNLNIADNHDGVVMYLELNILECEVKWDVGRSTTNKADGYDGIPAKLLKILKDDAVKVLNLICQKRLSNGLRPGKGQFSFQHKKEKCQSMFKVPYNWAHFICW